MASMAWKRRPGRTSKWITKKRRLAIYLRDHFTCQFCGKDLSVEAPADVHLDHIIPRTEGGSHHSFNLLTTCAGCNSQRANVDFEFWCAQCDADAAALYAQAERPLNLALATHLLNGTADRYEVIHTVRHTPAL